MLPVPLFDGVGVCMQSLSQLHSVAAVALEFLLVYTTSQDSDT